MRHYHVQWFAIPKSEQWREIQKPACADSTNGFLVGWMHDIVRRLFTTQGHSQDFTDEVGALPRILVMSACGVVHHGIQRFVDEDAIACVAVS